VIGLELTDAWASQVRPRFLTFPPVGPKFASRDLSRLSCGWRIRRGKCFPQTMPAWTLAQHQDGLFNLLKAAKALGLKVPISLLGRAHETIE